MPFLIIDELAKIVFANNKNPVGMRITSRQEV